METTAIQIFHGYVLPIVATITSTLATVAIGYLAAWLRTKLTSDKAKAFVSQLHDAAEDAVREAAQTTVATLQKEGRWNANTATIVRDNVMDAVKRHLGSQEIIAGAKALQISQQALEDRIRTMVEAAVHRIKGTQLQAIVDTTAVEKE